MFGHVSKGFSCFLCSKHTYINIQTIVVFKFTRISLPKTKKTKKYRILTSEIQIPPAVYSSKAQNNALGAGGKNKTGQIPWTVSRNTHDSLLGHPKFIALLLARPTGLSNVAF